MFLLLTSALVGGVFTAAVLWPYVGPLALICAPLGGSLMALVASGYIAWTQGRNELDDMSTGVQVAELQRIAKLGRASLDAEGDEPRLKAVS